MGWNNRNFHGWTKAASEQRADNERLLGVTSGPRDATSYPSQRSRKRVGS